MQAKESVFDRIGQTVDIYKKDCVSLSILFFILICFFEVVLANIVSEVFLSKIILQGEDIFGMLYTPEFMIWLIVAVMHFLLYMVLIIPVSVATIEGIKQLYHGDDMDIKANLKYGIEKIFYSMQTYWYIFVYVALMPLILLIVGLLCILTGMTAEIELLKNMGIMISGVALVLLIVSFVYRGLKSSFGLYSAVDKNTYTKENFKASVSVTDGKWWRIEGNILLIGFIMLILSGFITVLMQFLIAFIGVLMGGGGGDIDYVNLFLNPDTINPAQFSEIIDSGGVTILSIFESILGAFFQTIVSVFGLIFTYLLFKRLEEESASTVIENITAKKERRATIASSESEL